MEFVETTFADLQVAFADGWQAVKSAVTGIELPDQEQLGALAAQMRAFEVPLPDSLLLVGFLLLLFAVQRSYRSSFGRARDTLEAAYAAELVTANRRAHLAQSELTRLRKEVERERQKKRRLQYRVSARKSRQNSRPLTLLREVSDASPKVAP